MRTALMVPCLVALAGCSPACAPAARPTDAAVTVDALDAVRPPDPGPPTLAVGLDPYRMQRDFRWASPLEVVRLGVPALLERGIDPFEFDLPLTGFPEAASLGRPLNAPHTEEFLEQIAREYLTIGRGYARTIAAERHVSERTVVSWVQKARRRGILTRVRPGSYGGEIVQRSRRRPR